MNEERDHELENSQNWDYERPEVKVPVKLSRVVVSVAFRRHDFAQVSAYAERLGKKVSEFIREAAMEKATGGERSMPVCTSGSLGISFWGEQVCPITRSPGFQVEPSFLAVPVTTH